MADRKFDFDLARAIDILHKAQAAGFIAAGEMPESDGEKIMKAEDVVVGAQQTKAIAAAVGKGNVPTLPHIEEILFVAMVTGGTEEPSRAAASGREEPSPQPPSSPRPAGTGPDAPSSSGTASPEQPLPAPQESASPPPSSPQAEPEPQPQPEPVALAIGSTWSDPAGTPWVVRQLVEPDQVEVESEGGERTIVPRAFLKTRVADPPLVLSPTIDVSVVEADNAIVYTHATCVRGGSTDAPTAVGPATWVVPLDDGEPPSPGETRECAGCDATYPIGEVKLNGYVPPSQRPQTKEEPPSQPQQSSPQSSSSSSASSTPPQPSPTSQSPGGATPSSTISSSESPASAPAAGSSPTSGELVDDDEGDDEYRRVLDGVDARYHPAHMVVPHDHEGEPLSMPHDTTENPELNRHLHAQFNALSARARFQMNRHRAVARECELAVKLRMRPLKKEARAELGKDATETAVRELAEEDEVVQRWTRRAHDHNESAAAYQTFFEIYTKNVEVLSRDLTFAEGERQVA